MPQHFSVIIDFNSYIIALDNKILKKKLHRHWMWNSFFNQIKMHARVYITADVWQLVSLY